MTISSVIQRGSIAYVYDEKNRSLCSLSVSGGQLCGFSSTFVCIQRGSILYVYDEKGHHMSSISLGCAEFHSCAATINIKRGGMLYMYDEKGRSKGTRCI
ncbi:hypothetical protein IKQ26_06680 [bacterium]|nr:hypothetical protein [bacterium]